MKFTSHCILNHTVTTRSRLRRRLWWARHQHPDVEHVVYDDEGYVAVVYLRDR